MSIGAFVIAGILSTYTFLGRNLFRYSTQQQFAAQSQRTLQMFAQDMHAASDVTSFSASQFTLSLPYVHSDNSVTYYSVTYTYAYNSNAQIWTLVRTVSGTPPPNVTTSAITLLSGISPSGTDFFKYLDRYDGTASNTLGIKKISIPTFILISGTAASGTQTTYTTASACIVLRSKHLVTY